MQLKSFANPYISGNLAQSSYSPFGSVMLGRDFRGEKYKYSFNGGETIDEIYGDQNYIDLGQRGVDSRLGKLNWKTDPREMEYPFQSPYAYYANSPIWKLDYLGLGKQSTHTDEKGNVIQVKNDGDNGVYKHKGDTKKANENFKKNYKQENTSAGGEKMGETLTPLSFANFDAYQKDRTVIVGSGAKIDFESNWATDQVNSVLNANPFPLEYIRKAGHNGDWDIKRNAEKAGLGLYYGSKLFGKYASARDAGNFTAGAVAESSSLPNILWDYGYGVYNESENNLWRSVEIAFTDLHLHKSNPKILKEVVKLRANHGEDILSKAGIEAGKAHIKVKK